MKSRITDYSLDTHKHLLAAWAASTAASQSKYFRFSVEGGTEILLLGATGNIIHKNIETASFKELTSNQQIKKSFSNVEENKFDSSWQKINFKQ